jgi:hypothetical protein
MDEPVAEDAPEAQALVRVGSKGTRGAGNPGAVWRNGAFAGEFGDAFIAETDLEGGHSGPAITQLLVVVRDVLKQGGRAAQHPGLDETDLALLERAAAGLERAAAIEQEKDGGKSHEGFATFLASWMAQLRALDPGERLPFCGGWMAKGGGHALMFVAERCSAEEAAQGGDRFALVVCNTGQGVEYHPKRQGDYPKTKHRCAIRIKDIPAREFLQEGVWYLFHKIMCFPEKEHGPKMLYEVILPHLCDTIEVPRDEMSADEVEKWARGEGFPADVCAAISKHKLDSAALSSSGGEDKGGGGGVGPAELAFRARQLSCSLQHWTAADVALWLRKDLELPQPVADSLGAMGVDGQGLINLGAEGAEGLEALGVEAAHHPAILRGIQEEQARPTSAADRAKPAFECALTAHICAAPPHAPSHPRSLLSLPACLCWRCRTPHLLAVCRWSGWLTQLSLLCRACVVGGQAAHAPAARALRWRRRRRRGGGAHCAAGAGGAAGDADDDRRGR